MEVEFGSTGGEGSGGHAEQITTSAFWDPRATYSHGYEEVTPNADGTKTVTRYEETGVIGGAYDSQNVWVEHTSQVEVKSTYTTGMNEWERWLYWAPKEQRDDYFRYNRLVKVMGALGVIAAAPAIYAMIPKSPPKGTKKHPVTKEELHAWETSQKLAAEQSQKLSDLVVKGAGALVRHPVFLVPALYALVNLVEHYPRGSFDEEGNEVRPNGMISSGVGKSAEAALIAFGAASVAKEFRDWI